CPLRVHCVVFFYTDPARPSIYTLSLHDALPIFSYKWLEKIIGLSRTLLLLLNFSIYFAVKPICKGKKKRDHLLGCHRKVSCVMNVLHLNRMSLQKGSFNRYAVSLS